MGEYNSDCEFTMLKGLLKIFDDGHMDRLHAGALAVLERTGLHIQGEFLLRALSDAGCRVDFAARRAWFPPDLVERQLAGQRGRYKMVRSSLWFPFCRSLPEDDAAVPGEFTVDYGYATPWIYDFPQAGYRKPTIQDQIDMIQLGNALPAVKAINAAQLALAGDGTHKVSLDAAIHTLRETGRDMHDKYKETSRGGLAVAYTEC